MFWFRLTLVLGFATFFAACSTTQKLKDYKGSYLESVKLNYEAGVAAMAEESFDKAISYFQFVKSKYPFSQYASLCDLRIADVRFLQKKWVAAASAYEVFVRLHPLHENVEYALFRVGLSYVNALPSDFFLLPPPATRDQTYTKDALSALERFILQYPTSEFLADAKAKRLSLYSALSKHHQHVAEYYVKRAKYEAAVSRYFEVHALYPETDEAPESLFLAASLLIDKLNDPDRAMDALATIVDTRPDSPYAKDAQNKLDILVRKREGQ